MANIKFSDFTAFGSNPIDASSGLVAYKGTDNIQFTPAELAPLTGLYAANGTLASARTITMDGNTLSMAQASGNTVTFSSLNNEGISIAGGFNYKISTGTGGFTIDSSTSSNSNAISLQTTNVAGANASILIDSRSPGANADLHLKTATKLKIDLPVAATVGYVLKADDTAGNVSWGAETDTNTNIANRDLNLDASRTLGLGASQNLTFTGSGTSKVTFSNTGGVQFDEDVTFVKNTIIQGQAYTELNSLSNTLTVNWNDSNVQTISGLTTAAYTFTPTNPKAGATYILSLVQTGTVTPNWNNLIKWAAPDSNAVPPTLSGAGKTDVITLICYNASGAGAYYGSITKDLS